MANKSDLLASIAANLQQAIERKQPREQVSRILPTNSIECVCCFCRP